MQSEVKGAWFATAQRFLESHAPTALDDVAKAMSAEHRSVLLEPLGSAWYPEAALQELLAALFETIADHDLSRFEDLMRQSTHVGIGRFFRMLISLGSFRFVMRNVPTMWRRLRRGAGQVEVDIDASGHIATISYSAFPYFSDPLYRAMTIGSLTGMAEVAAGSPCDLEVLGAGDDWMSVRVRKLS